MTRNLTNSIRLWATLCWSAGFAVAAFDLLSIDVLGWRAPVSYVLFTAGAALCFWAEQREFGARVVLYRIHDLALYSSWKYLLLYFLWISLFAGFTEAPVKSLVYALTGWFSLIAVGFSAHFLFCERTSEQVFLLPKRLRWAFWAYAVSLAILFANHVAHFLFPSLGIGLMHRDPVSFFLYFSVGLPFLVWDFWNPRRKILPRFLSALVLTMGTASLLFSGRIFFLLSIAFGTAGILGFVIYKRLRFTRFVQSVILIGVMSSALFYFLFKNVAHDEMLYLAGYYEERLTSGLVSAWLTMKETRFLGAGAGITELRGVWVRVAAESGVVGLIFYNLFFLSLAGHLLFIRRSPRVVISNVALVSVAYFLALGALHVENPYGAYIWCWYALWSMFAQTSRKKESA